jgi:hypothetical protein
MTKTATTEHAQFDWDDFDKKVLSIELDYSDRAYYIFHVCQGWYKFFSKILTKQVEGNNGKAVYKLRWEYPMRIVPFINFIYDLFLDDSMPSAEGVKNLLDILGLLNALLFGAIVTVFTCVSFNDLTEADNRFMVDPTMGYGKYWSPPGKS